MSTEKTTAKRRSLADKLGRYDRPRDTLQLEIDRLRGLSVEKLIAEAQNIYTVELNATNGWTWLHRRVSYLALVRLSNGIISPRAQRNIDALNDPRVIADLKLEDEIMSRIATKKELKSKGIEKKPAEKRPTEKRPTEKKPTEKKPHESAAGLFQDLIMEGELTDDQIFKRVQEKFSLDDSKRSYVAWYRNYLKKRGKTIPTVTG